MARIRSIHPTLCTDEAYMEMSAFAKAAWPTLWTQCDDHGTFEWKPVVLKARLLPADVVDFSAILEELVRLGVVLKYEHDGRSYGLVRNFGRYQRPKEPKYSHDIPPEFREFCAYKHRARPPVGKTYPSGGEAVGNKSPTGGKPVPHLYRNGSEKSAQREEEGEYEEVREGAFSEEREERKEGERDYIGRRR